MKLAFHEDALEEYKQAALHYAGRSPELCLRFVEAVESAISQVLEAPSIGRVIDEDVRRCLTHVFPYQVVEKGCPCLFQPEPAKGATFARLPKSSAWKALDFAGPSVARSSRTLK